MIRIAALLAVACLVGMAPATQPSSSSEAPSCCTGEKTTTVSVTVAEPAAAAPSTAAALFDKLKVLSGKYDGKAPNGQVFTTSYNLSGGGSALVEEMTMHGSMTTVYTLDSTPNGDRILLTHYCAAGNQPRMVCKGLEGNVAKFTFLDATGNMTVPHMHNMTLTFKDNGIIHQAWELYTDGKPAMTVEFDLTPPAK